MLSISDMAIMFTLLVQLAVGLIAYGSLRQKVNSHADAIKDLWSDKVTKEEGEGYQAQLNRLERNDAECDGKLTAMREEFNARADRVALKIEHLEESRNVDAQMMASGMAEIKANWVSVKEGLARVEAEQLRLSQVLHQPAQQNDAMDILTTLRKADEFKRMLAGFTKT